MQTSEGLFFFFPFFDSDFNQSKLSLQSFNLQSYSMLVVKFGGTSVGKPERMKKIANLVMGMPGKKVVVLSALSGTTNTLDAHRQIIWWRSSIPQPSKRFQP
jgi:hypothetical protein